MYVSVSKYINCILPHLILPFTVAVCIDGDETRHTKYLGVEQDDKNRIKHTYSNKFNRQYTHK